MKKAILFFSFFALAFLLTTNQSFAQTTDSNSVAIKSNQIVTLLSTTLGLSKTQIPLVQSLVTQFCGKFSKTNVSSSGNVLKAKVAKEEQSTLQKNFSNELPKLLTNTQTTKYAGIKNDVGSLFTLVK